MDFLNPELRRLPVQMVPMGCRVAVAEVVAGHRRVQMEVAVAGVAPEAVADKADKVVWVVEAHLEWCCTTTAQTQTLSIVIFNRVIPDQAV
jgi:hypothetical protein